MPLTVNMKKHHDYLKFTVTGEYNLEEAIKEFALALNACKITDSSKVLIDSRQMTGQRTETEKILYAIRVIDFYRDYFESAGSEIKVAHILPKETRSSYEREENIANIKKAPFKWFDNIEGALDWLHN